MHVKDKIKLALWLTLLTALLAGCEQIANLFPVLNNQEVVLSDKPATLSAKPTRFTSDKTLKVVGMTSDLCVTLSNDAPDTGDEDAEYEKLMGGAKLSAVLHAGNGKSYNWTCNGWSYGPNGSGSGRMEACFRWECNKAPPKGTEIKSFDVTSNRPLRILGARWSSTAAFDFMSNPTPDPVAFSSAEYKTLEAAFGGKPAWSSPAQTAPEVTLESNRRRASFSEYHSSISIRLAEAGIQLEPGSNTVGMDIVTIPTAAVEACSMTCSSSLVRETNLLLTGQGIQLGFLNKPEVIDWCWRNKIPMATSASRRYWLYDQTALPARDSYVDQFKSRDAYDHQASQSCMGY